MHLSDTERVYTNSHYCLKLMTECHSHYCLKLMTECLYSWSAKTDPADVARVEKQTVICTALERDTLPRPKNNARSQLGVWMSPEDMDHELNLRFPSCMRGMLSVFFSLMLSVCRSVCLFSLSLSLLYVPSNRK